MSMKLFKSLLFKSMRIEKEIEKESKRSWKDHIRLVKLKKMRLAIKDQIQTVIRNSARKSQLFRPQMAFINRQNNKRNF